MNEACPFQYWSDCGHAHVSYCQNLFPCLKCYGVCMTGLNQVVSQKEIIMETVLSLVK